MLVNINKSTYETIINQLSYNTHEKIGILGSSGNNVIDRFILDAEALSEKHHCRLSISNASVLFDAAGFFVGIVHSHPSGKSMLSDADLVYARKILYASKGLPFILMGIVSDCSLYLYWIDDSNVLSLDLRIVMGASCSKSPSASVRPRISSLCP